MIFWTNFRVSNTHIPPYISTNKVNDLNEIQIDEINEAIINNSYNKCISNNREALERAHTKFEYHSPSATMAGGNGVHMGATLKKEVFLYQRDKQAWELFIGNEWVNYRDLGRNDKCICRSGKKYKKCCMEYAEICIRMYSDIENERDDYKVHNDAIGEKGIAEFSSKDRIVRA